MITEKNNSTAAQSDTSETATPEPIMKLVRRGSDPIPGILPLVGLGLPEGRETYTKDDLVKLREMGLNVMSANFPVPVSMERQGFSFIYKADAGNVSSAISLGEEAGMRIIPGTDRTVPKSSVVPSQQETMYTNLAWDAVTELYRNKLGCAASVLNVQPTVGHMSSVNTIASRILGKDQWHKPVLFPLLPISSTIADFGGDAEDGWTEENKFSRYLDALDEKCRPSVLWTSQKAFPVVHPNAGIDRRFLKELALVRDRAYRSHRAMWSTVHCTFSVQPPTTDISETEVTPDIVDVMGTKMKTEAHVALAMGARGLVFDSVCGEAMRKWYPARDPEVDNPFGQYLKEMNADIQKVSEAFLNTYVEYSFVTNGKQKEILGVGEIITGDVKVTVTNPQSEGGQLSENVLVSRIVNPFGSKEYFVVVNLGVREQTVKIGFTKKANQSTEPDQAVEVENLTLATTSGTATGSEFTVKLGAGDWQVFSY